MSGFGFDEKPCPNCGFQLEYEESEGWILYVDSHRVRIQLNYCPNCGHRLDPDNKPKAWEEEDGEKRLLGLPVTEVEREKLFTPEELEFIERLEYTDDLPKTL